MEFGRNANSEEGHEDVYGLLNEFIGDSNGVVTMQNAKSPGTQQRNESVFTNQSPGMISGACGTHRVLAPVPVLGLGENRSESNPSADNADIEIDVSDPESGPIAENEPEIGATGVVSVTEDALNEGEQILAYTERLLDTSNDASVYGGAIGTLSAEAMGFLDKIDSCLWPIRDDGWFWEGQRKLRKTKHIICHHPNMLSHSYLQTHPEGVLHILPGWTHNMFINDIAYRFSSRYVHRGFAVPFLGGMLCTMRLFNCGGVLVCQKCTPDFLMKRHTVVDPRDDCILDAVDARSPLEEAKKKVIGIYLALQERKKSVGGFCTARRIMQNGSVMSCEGVPKVIPSCTKPGTYFVGCTGYSWTEHEQGGAGKRNRHYASSLNLGGGMVEYLMKLISGEEEPLANDNTPCHYVRGKHKGRSTCPKHGSKLVEIPCRHYPNDKVSAHTMVTIEPEGYHEDTPDEKKALYVSFVGEHLHPAPPPPETTVMKMRIFEHICAEKDWTSLAQLRNKVECALLDAQNACRTGPEDNISLFDGTLSIPRSSLYQRLRLLPPPVSNLTVEVGELCTMAGNPDMPYVRDVRIVDEKYIFILGLDEQFVYASRRMSFAGDATNKTVTESNRSIQEGRWYLYNIVANASDDLLNTKGILVMRALVTGMTTNVYETVWSYFFKAIAKARGVCAGAEVLHGTCLKVPYIELPPLVAQNCCTVSSVTMDFDAAEMQGCCEALRKMCGGTRKTHMEHMMIECSVHLHRDIDRKTKDAERQKRAGMDQRSLWKAYNAFINADSPQSAEMALEKINSFDEDWVSWVRSHGMGPVLCNALSQMESTTRSLGCKTTNAVESQNRRENVLPGTHLRPSEAAKKLWDVDRVDVQNLAGGVFNQIVKARGYRNRSDSILRPCGTTTLSTRKRSKKGGGPAPLKKKKKTSNSAGSMSSTGVQKDASPEKDKGVTPTSSGKTNGGMCEQLPNLVQELLTDLLGDVSSMPLDGVHLCTEERSHRMDKRTNIIIDILHGVDEAGQRIENNSLKRVLLNGMRMDSVREDKQLRDAFVRIFRACMRPRTGSEKRSDGCVGGTSTGGADMTTADGSDGSGSR